MKIIHLKHSLRYQVQISLKQIEASPRILIFLEYSTNKGILKDLMFFWVNSKGFDIYSFYFIFLVTDIYIYSFKNTSVILKEIEKVFINKIIQSLQQKKKRSNTHSSLFDINVIVALQKIKERT